MLSGDCNVCINGKMPSYSATCVECGLSRKNYKPINNADRIRSMTDEELAEIFANNDCGYCRIHDFCFAKGSAINCDDVWLEWMKEEANDVS